MPKERKKPGYHGGVAAALKNWHKKQDRERLGANYGSQKPQRGKPEQEEQRLLVQWCRENGIYTILTQAEQLGRHSVGQIARIQAHRRSIGQTKGQPDLVLLVPKVGPVIVEVKSKVGRMTMEQKELAKFCQANGIKHLWGPFEKVSQALVDLMQIAGVPGEPPVIESFGSNT